MFPVRMASKNSIMSEKSSVSSKNLSSKKTTFKTMNMLKKRNDIGIIYNNEDVTPKLLAPTESVTCKYDALSLSQLDIRSHYEMSVFGNLSASVLHTNMHTQSIAAHSQYSYVSIINKEDFLDDSYSAKTALTSDESVEDEEGIYKEPQIMPKIINIILTETPVLYLLEITSTTEVKGTDEGEQVEKDNDYYDYLTVGKGRNRKTTNAEIQTAMNLLKTRSTNKTRPGHHNDYAFASQWDMFDTYSGVQEYVEQIINITPSKELLKTEVQNKFESKVEAISNSQQMENLLKNPKFQLSVMVMERVLANNVYNHQQKRFRGLVTQDPFRPDIEFKYKLDLLWTFKNQVVEGYPITAMQWHPFNSDILAVGYGKFYYTDNKKGYMYCWNVKNPTQPEREFSFDAPVTSLAFSQYETNLIAVGLYNGVVTILDISKKYVEQLMITKESDISSFEPIWAIQWFAPDGYNINDYHVITVCEDGNINSFLATKTNDLVHIELMKLFRTVDKLKGVYRPKECAANQIPVSKTDSGLIITKHPIEEGLYFVGTGQGSVHKCSENYQDQHLDITACHTGPVYTLQFSHFCSKLFLTCGADSCINIWVEDIKEPLSTLTKSLKPIECAEWCPSNSTIIANISGNQIFIWDLQRKTYLPASEHMNPTNCRNTVLRFSPSGRNLIVGDIEGNVHVYTLEDIPFPPFYQANMLSEVMFKNLITRQDLVKKLKQSGLCYKEGELNIY